MSSWIHVSGLFNIDGVKDLTDEEREMSFEQLIPVQKVGGPPAQPG